jgi:hypothetical protein
MQIFLKGNASIDTNRPQLQNYLSSKKETNHIMAGLKPAPKIIGKCLVFIMRGGRSWYSSVGIVTGHGLDSRGQIPSRSKRFFSSPQHPDRLWVPLIVLSNGYQGLLFWEQSGRRVKLTTHLNLVPKSRMVELYLHSPYVFMSWCLVN